MNLRQSAKGEACTVMLPGCLYGGETVVLAHIRRPWNAGVGMKPLDLHGCFACAACHDKIDGRTKHGLSRAELDSYLLDAHMRTVLRWKALEIL